VTIDAFFTTRSAFMTCFSTYLLGAVPLTAR
jgi:hypothetical protein